MNIKCIRGFFEVYFNWVLFRFRDFSFVGLRWVEEGGVIFLRDGGEGRGDFWVFLGFGINVWKRMLF